MKDKKLLLIDGSSLLFRAFYAIKELRTQDGIFTNGVYGFISMYLLAIKKVQPTHIAVALDTKAKTFRKKDYEAYKSNREKAPDELSSQFGILKDLLEALNISCFELDGYEADDLIGTIAKKASFDGFQNYLLTGDRDYFQLVDENTTVLYTRKGVSQLEEVNKDYIREKYGINPLQLIDVKGFQGDASDNIPGVPGIGEKTALALIRDYQDMDGVYEHIEEIAGPKRRENLEEYRSQAYLSRKLGEIFKDAPLDYRLKDLEVKAINKDMLMDRFERLEFQRFMEEFDLKIEEKVEDFSSKIIEKESWQDLAKKLGKEEKIYFALLSSRENYIHSFPSFAIFKIVGKETMLLALKDRKEEFKEAFSQIFTNKKTLFISYDIKESIFLLSRLGLVFEADYKDLMLMEYLIDPSRSSYDISNLARQYTKFQVMNREDLLGKGKKRKTFEEVDKEEILQYASGFMHALEDAETLLEEKIEALEMKELYERIENPLAKVLARMEEVGIGFDLEKLEDLGQTYQKDIERLEEEIYKEAGTKFNINSPKQLGVLLFEELNLPHGKKTKTGYSTAADILEKIQNSHPIIPLILEYRKLSKLVSTYVEGMKPYVDEDGRLRTTFKQNVAATGRLSSTEPNLQNIPIRTDEGRLLRSVFVPKKGHILLDCDYSQIELRILASLSGDENMIQSFLDGKDIHKITAAQVNHIPLDEVTSLQRSQAKAVNFGIIYGISDYGLSVDLNISRKEAKDYIEKYKAAYPDVEAYMESIVKEAKENGFVETFYGRRRLVPELTSSNYNIRSFGERIALNTPIQGTAADIIKIAMIQVDQALREKGFQARLVLQIHDELLVDCPIEESEEVSKLLVDIMESQDDFSVPLLVELEKGNNWYETN